MIIKNVILSVNRSKNSFKLDGPPWVNRAVPFIASVYSSNVSMADTTPETNSFGNVGRALDLCEIDMKTKTTFKQTSRVNLETNWFFQKEKKCIRSDFLKFNYHIFIKNFYQLYIVIKFYFFVKFPI